MPLLIMRALLDRVPTTPAVRWGIVLPIVVALLAALLAATSPESTFEPERQPRELSDRSSAGDGAEERVEADSGVAALAGGRAGIAAGLYRPLASAELDRRRPGFPVDILRPPRPTV